MDNIKEVLDAGLKGVKDTLAEQVKSAEAKLETLVAKHDEEVKNIGKSHIDTVENIKSIEASILAMKERQDAYEKEAGRLKGGNRVESFGSVLKDALRNNSERINKFKSDKSAFSFDVKAIMTEGSNFVNEVVEPTRVPGIKYGPERAARVRNFLAQGTTASNTVYYTQETAFTDQTAVTAEGIAKPQNDLTLTQLSAPVVKIASHFRVSEEALNDLDQLASHIALRGVEKYLNVEDTQLLYGVGGSGAIEGLTVSATGYAMDGYTDADAQEYDILIQGIKQLRDNNFNPTAAMVSIDRYVRMLQRKDSEGRYIMPDPVIFGAQRPTVMGIPIIATNAMADDDFLVADFPMMTTLFDREGVNVRFYEQDQDNAVKNLVTVVIEGRLALPTYLPGAGRYGDFADAIRNAGNS
jgi:HK97 family phage major capsid protein